MEGFSKTLQAVAVAITIVRGLQKPKEAKKKVKNTRVPFLHSPSFKETDFQGIYYKSTRFFIFFEDRSCCYNKAPTYGTHWSETSLEISVYGRKRRSVVHALEKSAVDVFN